MRAAKFVEGDIVRFVWRGQELSGEIRIVNVYAESVDYDIIAYAGDQNGLAHDLLAKHTAESDIVGLVYRADVGNEDGCDEPLFEPLYDASGNVQGYVFNGSEQDLLDYFNETLEGVFDLHGGFDPRSKSDVELRKYMKSVFECEPCVRIPAKFHDAIMSCWEVIRRGR